MPKFSQANNFDEKLKFNAYYILETGIKRYFIQRYLSFKLVFLSLSVTTEDGNSLLAICYNGQLVTLSCVNLQNFEGECIFKFREGLVFFNESTKTGIFDENTSFLEIKGRGGWGQKRGETFTCLRFPN